MKRIKMIVAAFLVAFSAPLFADDFDWSQCWCNYGAGIKPGDIILSVDAGISSTYFDAYNSGGWAIPTVAVDLQVACPVWKLPFSFGGYFDFGAKKVYDANKNGYRYTDFATGAAVTYHVQMPPEQLDLYTGIKSGIGLEFSDKYSSGRYAYFDWGYNIGASWYFNDNIGCNLELGYPISKTGVVFKF